MEKDLETIQEQIDQNDVENLLSLQKYTVAKYLDLADSQKKIPAKYKKKIRD